jgi:CRISPR-associated endoribonuclease Cas6|nr:CRISPR-associated endoribonuclease Cas6 [Desulfofarcimen acetoxidans]
MIQSLIYDTIGDELSSFLHDFGFIEEKRSFKMFTFSRVMGKYQIMEDGQRIYFNGPVKIIISSPMVEFCNSLINQFIIQGKVRIGKNQLQVMEVRSKKVIVKENEVSFRTLSPVVAYSTLLRSDGRKYTCYFQPGESDFERLLERNLRKKYNAFYKKDAPEGEVKVRVLGQSRLAVINYKDTIIKGYSGKLQVTGPRELLQMAVDSGLGSKNSQGFGCVEIV